MLREWTNLRKFHFHYFCQCIIDRNYPESEGRDKLLSKGYNPRPQAQPLPERSSGTAKEKPEFPSVLLEDLLLHPHAHPYPIPTTSPPKIPWPHLQWHIEFSFLDKVTFSFNKTFPKLLVSFEMLT